MDEKRKTALEAIAVQIAQEHYEEAEELLAAFAVEYLKLDTYENWQDGAAAAAEADRAAGE